VVPLWPKGREICFLNLIDPGRPERDIGMGSLGAICKDYRCFLSTSK